ncbi:hypothetical protein COU24_01510 [Candidatus Kuenenbacteria bacterium CG10_big_fil_rev_8_21_14_0_10_39_14]|uniref:Uncharacterized protein n=4 Tax=Candidatus Kueneniibacteriota TaxID=1752740 RepID=A0A2M7MGB4_9BACT|nr:MAG: hypothetical protein AUK13_00920 [Candidatus Kuenenbacteria bacterium CG2_30_39_24]PIR80900.1 MAG: hypothetical protein COU24_01510 [Candidatus Kuenenbacteria bacterium CG10_big_fil_rev_8_21_14_0_10_39_14]PIX92161.1 MAG: hypothetical protein COZ26_03335 [Candidatus Kuenenbacteria bacterium CG_4_10_14_3_um_filter_39_14]
MGNEKYFVQPKRAERSDDNKFMRQKSILSILNILTLCVVITAVSVFFVNNARWIGIVLIFLAILCVLSLIPFKIKLRSIQPDIVFGLIDNGVLAILAIFGGHFAGIAGAILGGVVGNAITDGIAGIFEGHSAEKLRLQLVPEERTMLKSAVGKMVGCLLGAGIVLAIANLVKF